MEHFNGVNSEVFNEDKDVDEFGAMLDKAKNEGQRKEDKNLLARLFDELKERFSGNDAKDEWNESDHPRAENGEFSNGSGGASASKEISTKSKTESSKSSASKSSISKVNSVSEVVTLLKANSDKDLFVRSSSGYKYDLKQGRSMDYQTHTYHAGLSAVRIDPSWLNESPALLLKRLTEYSFRPPIKGVKQRLTIYSGKEVGKDSDGYESITNIEPIAELSDNLVRSAPLVMAQHKVDYAKAKLERIKSTSTSNPLAEKEATIVERDLKEYEKELAKWTEILGGR